ncbi:hypothetical protein ACIRNY_07265 [Capnocytophaga canimorsus]|uniref:hypothetical protein n=1 Tax=Capnocytophaga canimorsus TaxID=28188 RepID=UPI0038512BE2
MNNKSVRTTFFLVISAVLWITMSSFVFRNEESLKDQSCTVEVRYSNGSPAGYVKVTTDVSGGIFCIGGREFKTNAEGKVTLYWVEDCKLTQVYVKGDTYKVDYQNGKSYTLTLKVNN